MDNFLEFLELFAVISDRYGTWPFTDSDSAWKFLEKAMQLETKHDTAWRIDKIYLSRMPHHDYEWSLISKVDNDIEDLEEVIRLVDDPKFQKGMNDLMSI